MVCVFEHCGILYDAPADARSAALTCGLTEGIRNQDGRRSLSQVRIKSRMDTEVDWQHTWVYNEQNRDGQH
jgi:hypothetical protein